MNHLAETIAAMSGVERREYWNTEIKRLSPLVAEAQARAQRNFEARTTMAEIDLNAACGPARAAKEFERDADIAAFIAAHEQALAQRRAQWDAHIRGTFGAAYDRYDEAVEMAQTMRDAEMAQAERPRREFEAAFAKGKQLAEWRNSAAGRKNAELAAEGERWAAREYQECVERGFPSAGWARWFAYDGMGTADFTSYETAAPWREKWLETHPHHREMLESHNPDAWDAAEAAHKGRELVTRSDRQRWPA